MTLLPTLLVWSAAAAASGDLMTSFTAEGVARLLDAQGHAYQITRDSEGAPLIVAQNPIIGHDYQVLFYLCRQGACDAIQLRAWFTHTAPIPPQQLNAWNSTQTFGRVFVDSDGDPTIDTFIYAHAGVPASHVSGELRYFLKVMRDFHDQLGDKIE